MTDEEFRKAPLEALVDIQNVKSTVPYPWKSAFVLCGAGERPLPFSGGKGESEGFLRKNG